MKHYCLCIDCFEKDGGSNVFAVGEVYSELFAICQCLVGHTCVSGLAHDLFDVLFTSGTHAYMKGFYSESVMSLTASLERAYELFIKLNLAKSGIEFNDIDSFWKEISNQSERQYGAFCSAYIIISGEIWKADQQQISFRNKVIHKGYIATSGEAKRYAEYVISCLNKIMQSIKMNFSEYTTSLYFHQKEAAKPEIKKALEDNPGAKFSATSNPSLLKWNYGDHEDATFDEAINLARKLNEKFCI